MPVEAIILAGGFGTRLSQVVSGVPKPMAPVNGKPFLQYILEYLLAYDVTHVILSVGYMHERISVFFGDEFRGVRLSYSIEDKPLGTGGAIKKALEETESGQVMVMNGDSMFRIDLSDFMNRHRNHKSSASIALRQHENASRYGNVVTDSTHRVVRFNEKSSTAAAGTINGGIYLLDKDVFLDRTRAMEVFSVERDFFEANTSTVGMYGFLYDNYFIDIGIPEDYARAQDEFKRTGN
jgi:D-glycero-alpha-D-manno-heptose 1-phosphate guanylyltransferase